MTDGMSTLLKWWTGREAGSWNWLNLLAVLGHRLRKLEACLHVEPSGQRVPQSDCERSDPEVEIIPVSHYRKDNAPMKTQSFAAGDIIIAEGTHGTHTFLILEGQVLICKETGKKKIPIATLGKDEVFGEMYLMDNAGFRSATAMAETEVALSVISKSEMEQYLQDTPPVIQSVLATLSKRLAQTSQECSILKYKQELPPLQDMLARNAALCYNHIDAIDAQLEAGSGTIVHR